MVHVDCARGAGGGQPAEFNLSGYVDFRVIILIVKNVHPAS